MIRGKNIDKQVLTAYNRAVFDLSGAAASEMVLLNPTRGITINNVYVVWVEAGSADAGVVIKIGATSGGTDYFTVTSSVSQTAGTVETYSSGSMTLSLVPAGTPIWIGHAGSKVGTGTCFVVIAYTVN